MTYRSQPDRRTLLRGVVGGAAALGLASFATACSSSDAAESRSKDGKTELTLGQHSNGAAVPAKVTVAQIDAIRNTLPQSVLDSGKLVIGIGALPAGFPPLAFVGDDQQTLTGSEPDLGRLVAAVFGLEPDIKNSTWENLFVGIDSGKTDVGVSNITDTEERKRKYDFASYRQDNLAFVVPKTDSWNFSDYQSLTGKTVAVGSGTNQERILLEWKKKLQGEGKDLQVKYFPSNNDTFVALAAGKIDAYFGPNPGAAYQVRQTQSTPNAVRIAGTFSGAGSSLQGLIAATTKKDSGLAKPLAAAINHLIEDGTYATWLKVWNLSNEAVKTSQINPPGLPLDNS